MINKIINNIMHFLLKVLDKFESNFYHKFTYISKNEIPKKKRISRLSIFNNGIWEDKGVWIGSENEHYHDVMKLINWEE